MATIKLTDALGLDADVTLAPFSALLKYFQQLPALRMNDAGFAKAAGLTLDQPALTALSSGLSFDKDVTAGPGSSAISVTAGAHASLELIQRTPAVTSLEDVNSADVAIAPGTCYVAFAVDASVGVSEGSDSGMLEFGIGPGETIEIRNYQSFPLQQGITLLTAVEKTVGNFVIPASSDDLASLPDGCVATVTGTGSLKLTATADLLAVTNPLAAVELPASLPALSVTAGGTVQVGATLNLSCTFQVSARKTAPGHVQLGWYRENTADFEVDATVSEGITAGFGTTDLFSTIVGAISGSASADLSELQNAGLAPEQIAAIQAAVKAAVNRKLALALSAEIGTTESGSTLFAYDIDVSALTADSRHAVDQALRGDLSGLHARVLPGVTPVESVWEKARSRRIALTVNLLGILNIGSISKLTASGSVLVEQATGSLVITDKSTADRIRSTAVNFGADTQKLRHVMAESFLLTATYQGLQQQVGGPALTCSHDFFDLTNDTGRDAMAHKLRIGSALGLFNGDDAALPPGIDNFGRTVIHASTSYDSALAETLFLDSAGGLFPHAIYENAGRAAIQLLVAEGDDDAGRREPAIDDDLWGRMKAQGQAGFALLFPNASAPLLGAITADYSAIVWWAEAMAGAGQRLAAIRNWFAGHPSTSMNDPEFETLRQSLASHLRNVTATTSEEFGEPWGLLAMDQASGRKASAAILISGPKLVRSKQRAITATAHL